MYLEDIAGGTPTETLPPKQPFSEEKLVSLIYKFVLIPGDPGVWQPRLATGFEGCLSELHCKLMFSAEMDKITKRLQEQKDVTYQK